jgi:SAM-dependent methyltransferase
MNLKYVLVGVARHYAPEWLMFVHLKLRGKSNSAESDPAAQFAEWKKRLDERGVTLTGKRVVEVGSGRYARLALRLVAAGASCVTLVDLYATPLDEPSHKSLLAHDCEGMGLDVNDALARIEVVQGDFTSLPVPSPDDRADLVISSAVLEHVRDPKAALACCGEWLKPGGVTCHVVDLRDHSLSFQYPFEMLTFSEPVWERWFNLRGGFHLNRWRAPDYVQSMRDAGFVNVSYEVLQRDEEGLRKILPRLNTRFREMGKDMLSVLVILLFGEKPL